MRHWEEHGFSLWAAEAKVTGVLVGLAHQGDWAEGPRETEVGWRLDRGYWGRGFATEGAKATVAYRLRDLGREAIISIIQPQNTASRRVAEKAGLPFYGETFWRNNAVVWHTIT